MRETHKKRKHPSDADLLEEVFADVKDSFHKEQSINVDTMTDAGKKQLVFDKQELELQELWKQKQELEELRKQKQELEELCKQKQELEELHKQKHELEELCK
jgi:hypothetical protein